VIRRQSLGKSRFIPLCNSCPAKIISLSAVEQIYAYLGVLKWRMYAGTLRFPLSTSSRSGLYQAWISSSSSTQTNNFTCCLLAWAELYSVQGAICLLLSAHDIHTLIEIIDGLSGSTTTTTTLRGIPLVRVALDYLQCGRKLTT
jgi:hypothetical protein